jgi:predicted ATPase/class 3 adenylate cyclase
MISKPTGTVTFLFTDIEGSTKLAREHPETWEAARARHHAILRNAIESCNGYIFQIIGDAFCAAFHTAGEALRAATKSQVELHTENWGNTPVKVRMGIHTGKAEIQDNVEYHGYLAMSRVQRLMSAGHGGQVLISAATQELLLEDLLENVSLRDLGERRLKDLIRPEHIYQPVIPGLPVDFAPLKTLDFYRHNLQVQLTSFIGRERELAEAKQLLSTTRLLTLTGPGGAGKTRLALQIGAEMLEHFQNGVWLVDLAPITDATLIIQTAMAVFGIAAQHDRPVLNTFRDYLRAKTLMLILDNCEHMVEDCAHFAEMILQAAPEVKILATSREVLGVMGEQIYRVPPLSTPSSKQLTIPEELTKFESIQLFVERAALVSPNFQLMRDNASSIAQICLRLDGMPLAIELAAARIRSMPVEQIASHINDRFRLLTGGSRTALPRQQTLLSLIEWSYDLLTEHERIFLRRLAVFLGGWTLESAEAVCAREAIDSFAVMDLLSKLVEKSLVVMEQSGRYKFLETIRQYAQDKLLESGEMEAIRHQHLTYFLAYAGLKGTETLGSNQIAALRELDEEYENIRKAMDWAIESGQLEDATQIGIALAWLYWWSRALFQEAYEKMRLILNHPATTKEKLFRSTALDIAALYGKFMRLNSKPVQAMIDEAIEIAKLAGETGRNQLAMAYATCGFCMIGQDNPVAEKVLDIGSSMARELDNKFILANTIAWQADLAGIQKDYSRAQQFSNESIRLFREMGNHWGIARALENIGSLSYSQGDYYGAQKYFEEALAIYRNIGAKPDLIFGLGSLGQILTLTANYVQAGELLEERLLLAKDSGWTQEIGTSAGDLAYLHLYQGNPASALALFRESLSLFDNGDEVDIGLSLVGIASAIFQLSPRNAEHAARLLGSAQSVIDTIGIDNLPYEKEQISTSLKTVRQHLGEANFQTLLSQGKAMTLDAAIALAQEAASV